MKKGTPASSGKNGNLGAVLLFVLLIALFYWKVIFGHSIFVFVDASRFFYPLWKWGAGVLNQGHIPLWNPDAQFGTPYFADPQMAYAYPPVPLLYLFLNPTNAFAAITILHHLWALIGFWFLAKSQGFSTKASLLGSLVFGFSLHLVTSAWTPVALMSISWIPWIFMGAEKLYKKEKNGFLLMSFTWAMQLAAGYPVLTYLTGLALCLHFCWKTWWPIQEGRARSFGWLGWFFLAALVATTYNLVWELPFVDYFRLSNYQNGASRFQDLHWLDLATAVSPFVQGHPLLSDYRGPHYWVSTYFVGLPALGLILWGALNLVYRKTSWGVLPLLLILSCGGLGLAEALRAFLPGYSLVVHSGYWISLLVLWAGLLVTESTDSLLEPAGPSKMGFRWVLVFAGIYACSFFISKPLGPLVFGLSLVFLIAAVIGRSGGWRWCFLLAALGLSLGPASYGINILLDRSYYDEPPKVLSSLSTKGRLLFTPTTTKQAALLQGANMEEAYGSAKESFYPNWPLAYGLEEVPVYNTLSLPGSNQWASDVFHFQYSAAHSRRVLDYLGIRYVLGKVMFKDFRKTGGTGNSVEIFENPNPSPKWFSVLRANLASNLVQDDFLRADLAKMDYQRECFIGDPAWVGPYGTRVVATSSSSPDRVEITAEGQGKALIISSETNFPGWKVRVEGVESQAEQVNHNFRAVVLEEGKTHAVFSFEPVTFRLGLFLSFLIVGLWGSLFVKGRMKI